MEREGGQFHAKLDRFSCPTGHGRFPGNCLFSPFWLACGHECLWVASPESPSGISQGRIIFIAAISISQWKMLSVLFIWPGQEKREYFRNFSATVSDDHARRQWWMRRAQREASLRGLRSLSSRNGSCLKRNSDCHYLCIYVFIYLFMLIRRKIFVKSGSN